MTKNSGPLFFSGLLCAALGFAAPARAAIAVNPGGALVVTNSTSAGITYEDTPVETRIDNYATTLLTFLNGGLFSTQNFGLAFSDPTVQSAVTSADSILAGDSASFGSPVQDSSVTALFSSVVTPPSSVTYSCLDFIAVGNPANPPGSSFTGQNVTTTTNFGPVSIMVGNCQSDTFFVIAGQSDINLNTENDFLVDRPVLTTDTFLTTSVYEIDGLTQQSPGGPVPVPEAGTMGMLTAGLGGLAMLRRRRSQRKLPPL